MEGGDGSGGEEVYEVDLAPPLEGSCAGSGSGEARVGGGAEGECRAEERGEAGAAEDALAAAGEGEGGEGEAQVEEAEEAEEEEEEEEVDGEGGAEGEGGEDSLRGAVDREGVEAYWYDDSDRLARRLARRGGGRNTRRRNQNSWVQCDDCCAWRLLPAAQLPLPDQWFCHMHPDSAFASCEARAWPVEVGRQWQASQILSQQHGDEAGGDWASQESRGDEVAPPPVLAPRGGASGEPFITLGALSARAELQLHSSQEEEAGEDGLWHWKQRAGRHRPLRYAESEG